ncbi:MAG: helix-turn-helix domain-containing protein [Kiritimatiellae bacterium]|nr:helix-turn-helix domain-containing protein [Kiritimatiellia bacterium]
MKKELFNELVESIEEAGKIRKGLAKPSRVFRYRPVDIKRIRNRLHVSQSQFSLMIGVSRSTLQNWEQGRREPEGPAKALLRVVDKQPQAVLEALQA